MKLAFIPLMLLLTLLSLATASPDEATGRVTKVVDVDTFDVQLQDHDSRVGEESDFPLKQDTPTESNLGPRDRLQSR
jgi:hypothetical protein